MIKFVYSGDFKNIEAFLAHVQKINYTPILERYGREGVSALASNTPIDTGLTANSWSYEINQNGSSLSIIWTNSNVINHVPIAVIIQYGHATRNGGYVQGRDYINPTLQPIFDKIANDIWEEVTKI